MMFLRRVSSFVLFIAMVAVAPPAICYGLQQRTAAFLGTTTTKVAPIRNLGGHPSQQSAISIRTARNRENSLSSSATRLFGSSSSSATSATAATAGKALEDWLVSPASPPPPAKLNLDCVEHATFGGDSANLLRGLKWKDGKSMPEPRTRVAEIPASKVLSTTGKGENWDADLAVKLWEEYAKSSSNGGYSGYLRFLADDGSTAANDGVPASVAPNALRHWSSNQKSELLLGDSDAGRRLLELDEKQQGAWKRKYEELGQDNRMMSWEQFEWSMEVVHSRAFRGLASAVGGGGASTGAALSWAAPVLAAAAGFAYYTTAGSSAAGDDSIVLVGLGAVAALPLILNLVNGGASGGDGDSSTVALLPFIDSANHLEKADSLIEYNPVTSCYELSVGPGCVDPETQQLYISYGKKGDAELLLNYGFLPGAVDSAEDDSNAEDNAARDRQRSILAREFRRRNGN